MGVPVDGGRNPGVLDRLRRVYIRFGGVGPRRLFPTDASIILAVSCIASCDV